MKLKTLFSMFTIATFLAISVGTASAHVSLQSKGYSIQAGQSSRLWLSLGHGCTYNNQKFGTSVFSVQVPSAAGKPTPEFHQGFKATVVASTEVDANKVPIFYTVTWTARTPSWSIDDGTFYDFGLKVTWSKVPQTIYFPTTQTCVARQSNGSKVSLFLKWLITDGSTKPSEPTVEWGPAPSITTVT